MRSRAVNNRDREMEIEMMLAVFTSLSSTKTLLERSRTSREASRLLNMRSGVPDRIDNYGSFVSFFLSILDSRAQAIR